MGYAKDKNYKITVRLNERQYDFIKSRAAEADCSPSEYLRRILDSFAEKQHIGPIGKKHD